MPALSTQFLYLIVSALQSSSLPIVLLFASLTIKLPQNHIQLFDNGFNFS